MRPPPAISLPDVAAPALLAPGAAPQAGEAARAGKAKVPRHAPATDARYGAVESGEPRYKPRSVAGAPMCCRHTGPARIACACWERHTLRVTAWLG